MGKKKKTISEIAAEAYTRMYENSVPKCSFQELQDTALPTDNRGRIVNGLGEYSNKKKFIFEAYFIPEDVLVDIVESTKKKYKLGRDFNAIYLGCGPTNMPEWSDLEEENKFKELCKKVDEGEEVTIIDLPSTLCNNHYNALLLYEYNRRSHPDVAAKYLNSHIEENGK